jgi:hypothetical protein
LAYGIAAPKIHRNYSEPLKLLVLSRAKELGSVPKAAEEQHIPVSTVYDWIAHQDQAIPLGKHRAAGGGRHTVLPTAVEEVLFKWVMDKRSRHEHVGVKDLILQAGEVHQASQGGHVNGSFKASRHWAHDFMKRHQLSLHWTHSRYKHAHADGNPTAEMPDEIKVQQFWSHFSLPRLTCVQGHWSPGFGGISTLGPTGSSMSMRLTFLLRSTPLRPLTRSTRPSLSA